MDTKFKPLTIFAKSPTLDAKPVLIVSLDLPENLENEKKPVGLSTNISSPLNPKGRIYKSL